MLSSYTFHILVKLSIHTFFILPLSSLYTVTFCVDLCELFLIFRLDDEEGMALENTYITWHNVEHYESYIKNIFDTGYISDAKFFTLNGVTYLVLIRFYDPIHDTHNLECVIMKQSSELTELVSLIIFA